MNSRSSCNRPSETGARALAILALACGLLIPTPAVAGGDAPGWLHALVSVPLPAHDEKTDAVLLYSEQVVTVETADRIRTVVREAYKILRPGGREYGTVRVSFHAGEKITGMRAWCIPAQGKDYEVRDKDAIEGSPPMIAGIELIKDVKNKVLIIPAADPGNIIGYEYQRDEQPLVLQDVWPFQGSAPVREAHYTLQLPPGWEYKATWLNAPEVKPVQSGNQWQWVVSDVKELRYEERMPPWSGIRGQMIVAFYPAGGAVPGKSFSDWRQMGTWYLELTRTRKEASPEMQQKVTALTATAATPVEKMRAIAQFLQRDVRYVAILLGIGGWQPHPAPEIFTHRYGDCKDKATLMSVMLQQIGVESYYVAINTERGSVTPGVQAHRSAFNHVILAIKLPAGVTDDSLSATLQHPKLGKILFFDPTNELTPFGELSGHLQANYGLLVTPDGGELIELPRQPAAMNSIQRSGKLALDGIGTLKGDIEEIRRGDRAWEQREALRTVTKEADRIKPIETLLSHSLGTFQLTKASVSNLQNTDQPFAYHYSLVAPNYAKPAAGLLLVRPRVVGTKSTGFLETREPRHFAVEFQGPTRDTDVFEIALPEGYEVDDLPPPVNLDYSFASYHSKSEVSGKVLRYTRTLEIKELSVPASKVEDLKRFYRAIASDERNTAVLKPAH